MGNDAPLFNRPQTETTITHLAGEVNVPGQLRRRALYDDLENYRRILTTGKGILATSYFGSRQPVLQVYFDQPCAAADPSTIACRCGRRRSSSAICAAGRRSVGSRPRAKPLCARSSSRAIRSTFETKVAVDPVLGRLAVLKNVTNPPTKIEVSYAYGFSGDLGGGPYDRRFVPRPDDPTPTAYENTVAAPSALGGFYRVSATGLNTVEDAITQWALDGKPNAVIQIDDSRTYEKDLTIPMAATDLVIQAANRQRPALIGNVTVAGNQKGRLALNGLLIAGSIAVADDSVRQLDVLHSTLVPGVMLDAKGKPAQPETPSIAVSATNKSLQVNLTRSITGPLRLPENMVGLNAQDCVIESPERGHPADLLPVLVSADLSSFPLGLPAAPSVRVTIGGDGPHLATLAAKPANLAQARSLLQDAIRNAHPTTAFAAAQVLAIDNRLVVLPGAPAEVTIESAEGDNTADLLKLTQIVGEQRLAVISGGLAPFPALSAGPSALAVSMGDETHDHHAISAYHAGAGPQQAEHRHPYSQCHACVQGSTHWQRQRP